MTLTVSDIDRIQKLYRDLERLRVLRVAIKTVPIEDVSGTAKKGTSSVEFHQFNGFSPETQEEIRAAIMSDLRRRAGKMVAELHKLGCEAQLTEE